MVDSIKDKCGVFGVWGSTDSVWMTYSAMFAQQHRGQESAGMAVWNDGELSAHVGMGLVAEVFDERTLEGLDGRAAIGHNRYSTTGSSQANNAQPLLEGYIGGQVAVAQAK